ncbi:hypothetical protein OESDEN_20843 [Oesophagostomum dentatum]|uniref:Uncharacterized protein n=1 Tax=Oesophagostomum dentatum TaxID=61180 RepID=A0A0B1S2C3_OESDE|nr:hypothetical protein OESDEN_20843 [Oesophagostomum dentatum]
MPCRRVLRPLLQRVRFNLRDYEPTVLYDTQMWSEWSMQV